MKVTGTTLGLRRGDSDSITLACFTDAAPPVAIPLVIGDTVYFTVKTSPYTDIKILQKIITSFVDGKAVIPFLPIDTKMLDGKNYVYDVQVTFSDATVRTIIPPATDSVAYFNILPEVTYE